MARERSASDCLIGGGEMGALMRSIDWAQTPLGPIESWPQSLRTTVSVCLSSRFPILVWWGPELVMLYNDAYRPILGSTKHPQAMGRGGREVWPEVWPIIGPMLEGVLTQGEATWSDDQLLLLDRNGFLEECYFTFSYSPIRDESGSVGGVFCAVTETTARVLGERRLQTLRALAEQATQAKTVDDACALAARTLADNPHDLPFAQIVETLEEPLGPDDQRTLVLPLAKAGTQEQPAGFLVVGTSPRLALNDDYRGFLDLVAGQIATTIANARATEEERKRIEALAELDRAKTAFFSNVSHEFRTPLTLLLGPLEDTLAQPDRLHAEDRERLELAHRNALRLLKLVNTLLDFSRIEAGRMQAAYEPADLALLTKEIASTFRSAIEHAGLRLVLDCPPLAEPVYVDREMWEKIVLNLLSNAFKFTFEGEIEVSLRQAGEGVELKVRDTGTGIPADELPHLFERFHRVKGARGRTFEGSGIGLALVQELAKLHGGSVRAESAVDRGSTFIVSLPLGTAHLPVDRIGVARTFASTVEEALRSLPEDRSELPAPSEARSSSKARILLAEDNADMREYVRRLLSREYEVVAVPDGAAALQAARNEPFDLVLSDVMMPQLDGFGLLAALRANEPTKAVPVLLLSARAGEEARVEGLEAGADDYLIKPFSAKELLARVDAHLRLQRVRHQSQAALHASEAKFSTAFDQSPLALTITSLADGRLVEVNEGFVRLSGYTREEALGRPPEELGLWVEPERRAERFARLGAGGRVPDIEARFRLKNGEERIGVIGSALVEIDGRLCVLSSVIDITERKRAEEALREADRRKDEFLAMLAHELRNPLTPIRNAAQVLKLVGPADANQQWAREVIERQTQHLTRLVDDLLDVSRITQGKVKLAREPLDLAAVLHRAVEASRPLIDARHHHLTVVLPAEPVRLEADLTRLVQVVGNLLNNAAKYTDEGGQIWIEAAQEGAEAVIRVRDNGMGVPAGLLPHVFDLFTQADRSLDRSQGGLGIGLTLVKRLVEMHGGRVEARSEGPGRGSEFIVRLPASSLPGEEAAAGQPAPPASRALKILVVEDNVDAAEMMSFLLTLGGHEVRTARDGPEALETARAFEPQAVLCDIGLPGMNGYEVAARLREQPAFQKTALIALTGYGQEEARRRSKEAGFDYHLVKPVEPEALDALLESLRADGKF
jgi:PAS domain S-box-containing protein